ncbi:G kinase-anchoring protein 1-like isoform X2 [Galleria mellonella]|uniref:G kinase-anchoring protein 1-like isoform X2 n=1 Tax=Galleria mellonella TaxID=7137 RepID=A0A6J1WAY6_GALME|nr:G kinase-anchoring protein 1-like isoform X2 [Galleria mellonella]
MAALVVQSRFAGLKIEDDDHPTTGDSQKSKKTKTNTAKKSEPTKKIKTNNKTQAITKKKKSKQNTPSADQWELWKQKDEELVDGNFESELQQAILLSKLDYEEKKDVYKQMKKEAELKKKIEEQNVRSGSKKQKKKNVMSLDQFNDLMSTGDEPKFNHEDDKDTNEDINSAGKDTEFFERIKDDAKSELLKDKINDRVRHRQTLPDEIITRVQFADALEKKDKEIAALKQEITTLKQELLTVKSRNKKLCNILGQGEMKDKAEVLVEVERLRAVQAELTAELAILHTDLEKERSKNTDPRAKDKKKKGGNGDKDK